MPLNTELMHTAQFTSALGYDYAGHGSKRESDDKKRLLVCLHFITHGSDSLSRASFRAGNRAIIERRALFMGGP